jgi:hypothetical protein
MLETLKTDTAKADRRRFCGVKGRSGPAKGNTNAIRHGLVAGKLPKDCQHIEIKMNALRRTLEDAVMAAKGEVNLIDAACIQTAVKWERHGALALRWLTKEAANLKPVERLTFSREIARASTERDRALAALALNVKPEPIDLRTYLVEQKSTANGNGAAT